MTHDIKNHTKASESLQSWENLWNISKSRVQFFLNYWNPIFIWKWSKESQITRIFFFYLMKDMHPSIFFTHQIQFRVMGQLEPVQAGQSPVRVRVDKQLWTLTLNFESSVNPNSTVLDSRRKLKVGKLNFCATKPKTLKNPQYWESLWSSRFESIQWDLQVKGMPELQNELSSALWGLHWIFSVD